MDKIIANLENVLSYLTSDSAWEGLSTQFRDPYGNIVGENNRLYDRACDEHQSRISKLKYAIHKLKEL